MSRAAADVPRRKVEAGVRDKDSRPLRRTKARIENNLTIARLANTFAK